MNTLIHSFHQAENNFFSLISFKQHTGDNFIAYISGVQASGLNPIILHKNDKHTLKQELQTCYTFYSQEQVPWALIVPEYLQSNISDLLNEQAHWVDEGMAMVLHLGQVSNPSTPSPLLIKQVDTQLDTWSIPLIHGFESTPERTGVYTQRHHDALQKTNALHHFSGFVQDEVVCSLSVSLNGAYARIDDVATIPAHQGKGYATTLIHEVLDCLKELGVQICFLEASVSGLSIYKKIGFQELFKNHYFESPGN
jgi:ribosomal protein S18 acetylase RimI-like enzyme